MVRLIQRPEYFLEHPSGNKAGGMTHKLIYKSSCRVKNMHNSFFSGFAFLNTFTVALISVDLSDKKLIFDSYLDNLLVVHYLKRVFRRKLPA